MIQSKQQFGRRQITPWVNDYALLASQWDSEKNSVGPEYFGRGSDKRVWWKCEKQHSWEAQLSSRIGGSGCPVCSGRATTIENSLAAVFPDIVKEWSHDKNGSDPLTVCSGSSKTVWWICERGHEWKASVCNRTKQIGTGCPYCAGKKADVSNSILLTHPHVCLQYHPTKNDRDLSAVRPKSHRKAWWLCSKGHEWQATFASRTHLNTGCPLCCQKNRSKLEVRIYCELKALFSGVTLRDVSFGKEMDVYVPTLRIGIETDGHRWHVDREEKDIAKTEFLSDHGITIIRLREQPLSPLGPYDLIFKNTMSHKHEIVADLMRQIEIVSGVSILYDSTQWLNDAEYLQFIT